MRRWLPILALLMLVLILPAGGARAHWGGKLPGYRGATPKALCYKIDDGLDDQWRKWIETAVDNWNQANTGWTFKPCAKDDNNPDIWFAPNYGKDKIKGGAKGTPNGGGADGYWEIIVERDVNGMDVNGKTVKGDKDNKGWGLEDKGGETLLDPVLVLGHELGHALGLDHDPGCDTGHLEDPICAGNHNNPKGGKPSANDIAEVKKGIAAQQANEAAAKKALEDKKAEEGGSQAPKTPGEKHNAPSALENAVLNEINFARTRPSDYAVTLARGPQSPATADAIAFLRRQAPLPPIAYSPQLGDAAVKQAADQGPRGLTGHAGSDGSTPAQRMQREGVFTTIFAEEQSLGEATASGVVRQLVVDATSPSHAHRADLFGPLFKFAGVGCGPHRTFHAMCVIDLTAGMMAR